MASGELGTASNAQVWDVNSFLKWGVAKLVKAPDFDSGIRGFESFLPSPIMACRLLWPARASLMKARPFVLNRHWSNSHAVRQPDGLYR